MKAAGIVRRTDNLGRAVSSKERRQNKRKRKQKIRKALILQALCPVGALPLFVAAALLADFSLRKRWETT